MSKWIYSVWWYFLPLFLSFGRILQPSVPTYLSIHLCISQTINALFCNYNTLHYHILTCLCPTDALRLWFWSLSKLYRCSSSSSPTLGPQSGLCPMSILPAKVPRGSCRETHPLLQGTVQQDRAEGSFYQGQGCLQQEDAGTTHTPGAVCCNESINWATIAHSYIISTYRGLELIMCLY